MVRDIMLKATFYKLKEKKAEIEKKLIQMPKRIKEAVEDGINFCENGSWGKALEEKKSLQRELCEINYRLENAFLIEDLVSDDGKVEIGKKVKVRDVETEKESWLKVIGSTDIIYASKIEENGSYLVSSESPIGSCLIGKTVGEKIKVSLPRGRKTKILILEVKPLG